MVDQETIEINKIPEESINKIAEILVAIKINQNSKEVNPQRLFELYYYLKEIKVKNYNEDP